MEFVVDWVEEKESQKTGVKYLRATLVDSNGKKYEDVAVFDYYDSYKDVRPGAKIEGTLREGEFRGKKSYTLANSDNKEKKSSYAGKNANIERKEESINRAMDKKDSSIKTSATFRDATQIVSALMEKNDNPSREWVESEWKRWRIWLWNNFEVDEE